MEPYTQSQITPRGVGVRAGVKRVTKDSENSLILKFQAFRRRECINFIPFSYSLGNSTSLTVYKVPFLLYVFTYVISEKGPYGAENKN